MQAHCREFHARRKGISTAELPSRQLECLFILRFALIASLGRIADIAWSRLLGLVAPIMHGRSHPLIRAALRQSVLLTVCALLLSLPVGAQTPSDDPAAEPV